MASITTIYNYETFMQLQVNFTLGGVSCRNCVQSYSICTVPLSTLKPMNNAMIYSLLRCFNRMNDLVPDARVEGEVIFDGENLYAPQVDAVEVRRRIGMVFQKPNPFPKSIYDNTAFGPRINGYDGDLDTLVEESLRQAALWDEVRAPDAAQRMGKLAGYRLPFPTTEDV